MWKKRRAKRKSFKLPIKILTLIIFLVLTFVIYFISQRIFVIKQVEAEVKGLGCFDAGQLKNNSGFLGQNLFFVDTERLTNDIKKKNLCLKTLAVSKIFPDKVKLQVFPRQPLVNVIVLKEKEASISSLITNISTPSAEESNGSFFVDDEGVVYSQSLNALGIPRIYIDQDNIVLGKKLEHQLTISISKILDKSKKLGIEVLQGWLQEDSILIIPKSGPKTIFRIDEKIDIQLASLQLILVEAKMFQGTVPANAGEDLKELEFIDLRFDKPVVKFAPQKKLWQKIE